MLFRSLFRKLFSAWPTLRFPVLLLCIAGALPGTVSGAVSGGPDLTILDLSGVANFGDGGACPPGYSGTCRGYAVGTDSCNSGSAPVDFCNQETCRTDTDEFHPLVATVSDYPVLAQNLYRLANGRFEQIGLSFAAVSFLSSNSANDECEWNDAGSANPSCVMPPFGADQQGVGCTNFDTASLNGFQLGLGQRSAVQAAGAAHPPEATGGAINTAYDRRIVVAEQDLDPALNPGALYWLEGHYVTRDDARTGNGLNNASYRQVQVGPMPSLNLTLTGSTVRHRPAIFAWQDADSEVEIVRVDRLTAFDGEAADAPAIGQTHPDYSVLERFYAARRVSQIGDVYHYEYAIYNMNSDTSADGFSVAFAGPVSFDNAGFRDIDHHSSEPYDTADWSVEVDGPNGVISWTAVDAGINTNALRWGTLFTFWFDANLPPSELDHQLRLFKADESLNVPFAEASSIFADDFETGDTSRWD